MFVDGRWVDGNGKIDVKNPATGEVEYRVARCGEEEAQEAIDAAKRAFIDWANTPAIKRADIIEKASRMLLENRCRLAQVITKEMGKPIGDAEKEVEMAAAYYKWFAEEARRVYGETIPTKDRWQKLFVWKQPIGVVAAITPWNFPLAMIARKVAPALAAGCTVVLKPASEAPQSAAETVKCLIKCGLPPGVLNVVTGAAEPITSVWLTARDVRKVTFTGSTKVGKEIYETAARTIKKVSLELGGHAPFIVYDDADIETACAGLLLTKFRCSGQMCTATNRIFVQQNVLNAFCETLTAKVEQLTVGEGQDRHTDVGPLIDERALEKVNRHVTEAVASGAMLWTGGKVLDEGKYCRGYFYSPTVISGVTPSMSVYREETFGPVAAVTSFADEEELFHMANDTDYGLAAYVYTNHLGRMMRTAERLDCGIIGGNDPLPFSVEAPFGGMKESGIGREGSKYGIEEFLEIKSVSIKYGES